MHQKSYEYDRRMIDVKGYATSVLECEMRVRRHEGQRRGACRGELWSSSESSKPRDVDCDIATSGAAQDATNFVRQLRDPVGSGSCTESTEGYARHAL
ncbi:hypothetical protein HPB50_027134 [Hyalomma asiaticum]|uniref:Uncharacterized protein n=1 Tax=Hyalomma asiaticum TaxID=266040 RepID=A0ACB7T4Z7_HYAAI|nr:hypothetical protein HPB50_027134 [Hyalomma asiaticum]